MILYKRHKQDCQYRKGGGKDRNQAHRCKCSVWVEWNIKGKQNRHPVRDAAGQTTSSWTEAEKLAGCNTETTGNPALAMRSASATVADAVKLFIDSKTAEGIEPNTLSKYKLTLSRLEEYCESQGITTLADVSSATLLAWSDDWSYYTSAIAKLNNQSRLGTFFEFCLSREYIPKNPMKKDDSFKKKAKRLGKLARKECQETVSPLGPKEYESLIKAVDHVKTLTATQTARVKTLMHLQRWSGLSLVDAVCLSKDELIEKGGVYRVSTERQKTKATINNVIPVWLGQELLAVKNGNPQYFFCTGEATSKSAVSSFDKMYRKVFKQAKIETDGKLSHRFRHTFAVELLKVGVDIRKVSKALGHSSVTITEKYYAKWNKAQQDLLDVDLTGAWGKQ